MLLRANCKINIGLRVKYRRPDGYHEIETLFYPVKKLYDTLQVERIDDGGQTIRLIVSGMTLDCSDDDNLLVRTYRHMVGLYPSIGSVSVHLDKRVPFGAGLGGGSSDAAHLAIALNELFELGLSADQLAAAVKPIGADCPFFVYNTPCRATGIGDQLVPAELDWTGKRLVMLKPDVSVSTKEAYSGIHLHNEPFDIRVNDFEPTVFERYPILMRLKQQLLADGAEYAAMSGSGSTIFGVFEDNAESRAMLKLRLQDKEFATMVIFNDTL